MEKSMKIGKRKEIRGKCEKKKDERQNMKGKMKSKG
jgi:hypothetical protein